MSLRRDDCGAVSSTLSASGASGWRSGGLGSDAEDLLRPAEHLVTLTEGGRVGDAEGDTGGHRLVHLVVVEGHVDHASRRQALVSPEVHPEVPHRRLEIDGDDAVAAAVECGLEADRQVVLFGMVRASRLRREVVGHQVAEVAPAEHLAGLVDHEGGVFVAHRQVQDLAQGEFLGEAQLDHRGLVGFGQCRLHVVSPCVRGRAYPKRTRSLVILGQDPVNILYH